MASLNSHLRVSSFDETILVARDRPDNCHYFTKMGRRAPIKGKYRAQENDEQELARVPSRRSIGDLLEPNTQSFFALNFSRNDTRKENFNDYLSLILLFQMPRNIRRVVNKIEFRDFSLLVELSDVSTYIT